MQIKLTDPAIEDMRWATQYYDSVFPDGLSNFIKAYKTTIMLLAENPYLGRNYDRVEDVRVLTLVKTPFAFFYRVTPLCIEVLRVWDQRQDRARLRLD